MFDSACYKLSLRDGQFLTCANRVELHLALGEFAKALVRGEDKLWALVLSQRSVSYWITFLLYGRVRWIPFMFVRLISLNLVPTRLGALITLLPTSCVGEWERRVDSCVAGSITSRVSSGAKQDKMDSRAWLIRDSLMVMAGTGLARHKVSMILSLSLACLRAWNQTSIGFLSCLLSNQRS